MARKTKSVTRRDCCHLTGKRAAMLDAKQSVLAWAFLSGYVRSLGEPERHTLPKFADLMHGIRSATIHAKWKQ